MDELNRKRAWVSFVTVDNRMLKIIIIITIIILIMIIIIIDTYIARYPLIAQSAVQ